MRKKTAFILFLLLFSVAVYLLFKTLDQNTGEQNMDDVLSASSSAQNVSETSDSAAVSEQEVKIVSSKGSFTIRLFSSETPKTVSNFISKAQSGFYDNLTFHRVESWVVQGGDPLGTGTGGGDMETELSQRPFKEGSVGVARGNDITISNDSQFFICTQDCSWLTANYTNFGEVIEGMDIVKKIAVGDTIVSVTLVK